MSDKTSDRPKPSAFAPLVCVALVVAAACSGSPPEELSGGDSFERSVLTQDYEVANRAMLEIEDQFQDFLATCIRATGFEYWPVKQQIEAEFATQMQSVFAETVRFPSDEDEATRRGLGIVEALHKAQELGLVAEPPPIPGLAQNREYVQGLTNNEADSYAFEKGVCVERAFAEVESPEAVFDIVYEVEQAVEQRVQANRTYLEMNDSWLSCMRGEGFVESDSGISSPQQYLAEIQQAMLGSIEDPDDRASLDNALAAEVDIALAALTCGADKEFYDEIEAIRLRELLAELDRRGL